MANPLSAIASIMSLTALILVAVSIATNYWVRIDNPRVISTEVNDDDYNPQATVSFENPTLIINYDLDYLGLWVGCHRDTQFDKISCGYVGASCYSNICWVRNGKEEKCANNKVVALSKCAGYQATRAFAIMGTILLILGSSLQVVSICVSSRNISSGGAVFTLLSALFLMIAFAIFQGNVFTGGSLNKIGRVSWSFVLFIIAWPLAILGAILGFLSSMASPKQEAEYDESE